MTVGTRVEGAVVLAHREPRAFAPRHLNLLSVLSSSAALFVRNAELYARSEEAAISEERTRIAREIHDGLAQDLSYLILKAHTMQRQLEKGHSRQVQAELEELMAALRRDVREVRRTIHALRPLDLETLGFLPALEKFIDEFGNANEIQVRLQRSTDTARRSTGLSPKLQLALFRLIQESLNNIRKHAHATQVGIELDIDDRAARVTIRDNGQGFDPAHALQAARERGSVGMISMRERAERAGGSFHLDTAPGQGTTIRVELPIK
jgi:signal transduction histidine kinase